MAAEGEEYEWTQMYPGFEKIAIEEKDKDAAKLFGSLKLVEEKHEERYIIIARKLDDKTLYDADAELEWKCVNCGFIYKENSHRQVVLFAKNPFLVHATWTCAMISTIKKTPLSPAGPFTVFMTSH